MKLCGPALTGDLSGRQPLPSLPTLPFWKRRPIAASSKPLRTWLKRESNFPPKKSKREARPAQAGLPLEARLATDNRLDDLNVLEASWLGCQGVLGQNDQVGQFADFDRAPCFFLEVLPGGIDGDCL